jgi:hypothetical protein
MRMRQHNPIQVQGPPQIDFSELQLKNFNKQFSLFMKETNNDGAAQRQDQYA